MIDGRIVRFEQWHEMVFGPHPIRERIPFQVMRDYLDCLWELSRARAGVDHSLDKLSISEIKERGHAFYLHQKEAGIA